MCMMREGQRHGLSQYELTRSIGVGDDPEPASKKSSMEAAITKTLDEENRLIPKDKDKCAETTKKVLLKQQRIETVRRGARQR